jgi:hypothetical protein
MATVIVKHINAKAYAAWIGVVSMFSGFIAGAVYAVWTIVADPGNYGVGIIYLVTTP